MLSIIHTLLNDFLFLFFKRTISGYKYTDIKTYRLLLVFMYDSMFSDDDCISFDILMLFSVSLFTIFAIFSTSSYVVVLNSDLLRLPINPNGADLLVLLVPAGKGDSRFWANFSKSAALLYVLIWLFRRYSATAPFKWSPQEGSMLNGSGKVITKV